MSSSDDMDARHSRMLAEIAEAGMAMVGRLSEALHAAKDTQDLVTIANAFHKVTRAVRQTIALEFKLRHAPREPAALRPEPKPAASPPPEREERPERADWNEYERPDWDEPLDALLSGDDREAINEALDISIARIRGDLTTAGAVLTTVCHPGLGEAQDRDPDLLRPKPEPGRRSALLSTSSHRGPRNRDAAAGPATPPWRNSG